MPSHLTRIVFRRIIANEPLLYRGCRHHHTIRPRFADHHGPRALPQIQRRTFFELFKPRRKLKPAELPAGLETMSALTLAQNAQVRPPEAKELAEAFKAFFAQKKGAFEDFDIGHAHRTLQYLLEHPRDDGTPWLSKDELDQTVFGRLMDLSTRPRTGGREAHLKFGRTVLEEITKEVPGEEGEKTDPSTAAAAERSNAVNWKTVQLLAAFGSAREATQFASSAYKFDPNAPSDQNHNVKRAWGRILSSIASRGDTEEMLLVIEGFQGASVPLTKKWQDLLVTFFAKQKDLERAKFWYSCPVIGRTGPGDGVPLGSTSSALLRACALSGDMTFGHQVVASLLKDDMPDKAAWDAVFLWSAAIGKGADEVDRMMNVLIRRNDEARKNSPTIDIIRPDVDTINTLVEYSISKNDPYMAERFIALGEKRGISPNEKTFAMQIQYRLSVGDTDGARAAYLNLQGDFSGAEHSVVVVNQLIQALCDAKQHHFDELMVMVDDLHERKAYFAPETVAALSILHLRRGETNDAIDILQVHAHLFTPEQRAIIRKGLLAFILDGKTSTSDAWDTYRILRLVFLETPREDRIKILNEFFARKRSDMACHVFFHMRNHISEKYSANKEVYVAAFTGFARCADAESLELAHNQLKLDFNVNLDTRLRNALMLAYAETKQNQKALQFWREICESKEGPSYNSIAIAFRSCEGMHYGYGHARAIWKRLKEQDVEIDKKIWTAYMCAMARNHQRDEALALIENVEEDYGFTPDLDMYVYSLPSLRSTILTRTAWAIGSI
jgi:hypothetical protein